MAAFLFATEAGGGGPATPSPPTPQGAIGWTIAILLMVGFGVAMFINMRRARPEIGAELELAANRKPYLSDEELEGRKLDRTLGAGLVLLAFVSISLPLYWLYEPARQEGAIEKFHFDAVRFGKRVYDEKANCAQCHGPEGGGGLAATSLLDDNGQFVRQVEWQAPALDTVLYRYSKEEVKDILIYGRPSTPMPAWGAEGGGPLTDQQLDNVITYLESIQLPADQAKLALEKQIAKECAPDAAGKCTVEFKTATGATIKYETLGEALFNLGLYDSFAGGAYSCGRCHTRGFPYGLPEEPGKGGTSGWNLTDADKHFSTAALQEDFVADGSEKGKPVGKGPLGNGQMPGFGTNPNAEEEGSRMSADQVMYTPAQIAAIVEYERNLR